MKRIRIAARWVVFAWIVVGWLIVVPLAILRSGGGAP